MNNSGVDISRYEIRQRIFKENIPRWVRLDGLEIGKEDDVIVCPLSALKD